tara:strand:+ start:461 stop:1075 length:615 start_codon:yes stop_codon:yes gene_type:complete
MNSTGNLVDCPKGHVYDSLENDSCPWCPSDGDDSNIDNGKTVILGGENSSPNPKTVKISSDTIATSEQKSSNAHDLGKTIIRRPDEDSTKENTPKQSVQRRRLRGWLVTYDHADYGDDYKITEGSNTIGSKSDNTITIADSSISSSHAIILYKQGEFLLSDEMSSNGTFVNGEEIQPRIPVKISDGDNIKVGDTTFLFRTSFKN